MIKPLVAAIIVSFSTKIVAQNKILFDASKGQTAGNADWIIDADLNNMRWSPNAIINSGTESNAQLMPTPTYTNVTNFTGEFYWQGGISGWGVDCAKQGWIPQSLPYNGSITYKNSANPEDLSNYKTFVTVEPNILFTAVEKTAIIDYIKDGGSLFAVAGHEGADRNFDGFDAQDILNELFKNEAIGIYFDSTDISEPTNNFVFTVGDTIMDGPFGKPNQMELFGGCTITIDTLINTNTKGLFFRNSVSNKGTTNIVAAKTRLGKGKIFVLTDSSPTDDGTGDVNDILYDGYFSEANGHHRKLIMNAMVWLMGNGIAPNSIDNSILNKPNFYPNPAYNNITVAKNTSTIIYNINGKELLNTNQTTINIAALNNGMYIIKTRSNNTATWGKLIKQ